MRQQRRQFLKSVGATGASLAMTTSPAIPAARGGGDPLRVGVIGPGGMGMSHVRGFASYEDTEVVCVCDADSERMAAAAREAEGLQGKAPRLVSDMRRIFEDEEVDAVVIATPDHWHAPAAILACDAGKHVYVEKPVSHNLREGRLLIEAAARNEVVVQHGTQSRSTAHVRKAMERLREGAIGEILTAKAWNSQKRGSIGKAQPSEPPEHLDYDLWTGPAPKTPYQSNKLHSVWRWWFDYGCGDIGNDGVHDLDLARWGLEVDEHPVRIAALGGKYFFDDDMQWPDTQNVLYEYAPGGDTGRPRQLLFEQRIWSPYKQETHENGNAFYGTKGMLLLGKNDGYKLYAEKNRLVEEVEGGVDLKAHHRNFIEAIRGQASLHADAKEAHLSSSLCHLANVATRVGRLLRFDPEGEKVADDEEANELIGRTYRDHWAVPGRV